MRQPDRPEAMDYLFLPQSPVPTAIKSWATEVSPQWENVTKRNQGAYQGLYQSSGGVGDSLSIDNSVAIGGGATIDLIYDGLSESEVSALYSFWQQIIAREQTRDSSVFRISPTHCLWSLGCFPRTFQLVNELWAISNKSLEFQYQGVGECGCLQKTELQLISVPEVLSYE